MPARQQSGQRLLQDALRLRVGAQGDLGEHARDVLVGRAAEDDDHRVVADVGADGADQGVDRFGVVSAVPPQAASAADAIVFTSSSTVTNYLDAGGPLPPVVVCIGPVTATTATERGISVTAVAHPHTVEGVVDALTHSL